jgi:PAS domain S-box-containing protein
VIGVLQLNDHRKNRFSLEQIHFFEGIAGSVGVAIKRVADEDKIRHNEARLKSVLKLSQLKYKSESELFDFALSEATLLSQSEAGYLFSVNDRAGELCVLSHSGVKREIKDEQSAIFPMIQDSINAKRPMIINHFGGNSLSGEENGTPHLRRLLVIPLISDDKVVTVICLKNRREPYTDMDITQVSLLMEVVSKMRDQDRAAKKEQEHYMALDVLSKSAMDFIKYKSQEEIFELIIEKLSLLADCRQVMTISFDPFQKNFRMEKLSGFPAEHMLDLSESAGKDILSMRFRIPLHYLRSLSGGQIVRSEKNFSEFLLPLNGISLVELDRQLSGKNIYLVGLSDNDQVFGAVAFFTEKNVTLNHPLLETFFRQASVALKKSNIISELKKSESRFTSLFEQNNDIVFTLNHREMLTSINPIGEKLITGKFEPGIKIGQFLAPDSYRKLHHTFLETIRMRQNYCAGEMEVYTRNGKLLTFQAGFSLTYIGNKLYEIFGIARNITENKMLQNQVLSKIIETEEKEKKAFAEELHDGLGSLLSTINIYVGLLRKKEKSEADRDVYLKELHNLVNDAVANVRNYANSLTPNVLNDFGLISAVTLFGEKINTTQPGLVTFDFPATEITISRIIEINIYRILLELMNNSMKYSNANSIRISIHEDGAHLRVSYSDNGKGFDLEKVLTSEVSGMGIKNIYTRVSSLNGTCELYSQNGKGVRVEISIPIIPELHN